jgi:hypothetical protein
MVNSFHEYLKSIFQVPSTAGDLFAEYKINAAELFVEVFGLFACTCACTWGADEAPKYTKPL